MPVLLVTSSEWSDDHMSDILGVQGTVKIVHMLNEYELELNFLVC